MRLTEPFVWANVKSVVISLRDLFLKRCGYSNRIFDKLSKEDKKAKRNELKQQIRDASICSFLNSTMNMEYVYFILQGIDKLMAN